MNDKSLQNVSVVGISHQTAPVSVREAVALTAPQVREVLARMHVEGVFEEAVVLSTCNRTEVYFVRHGGDDALGYALDRIGQVKDMASVADRSSFYQRDGGDAVRHLFNVAAGLDSQLVGEHEILGQLKRAYRVALVAQNTRFLLNKLMHWAFRVGKRVHARTQLGQGSVSVPHAAVELAGRTLDGLAGKSVLLVGAGEAGELAAKAVLRRGPARILVANRTLARAEQVAERLTRLNPSAGPLVRCPAVLRGHGGRNAVLADDAGPPRPTVEPMALADLSRAIGEVDLVIASVSAEEHVLTYDGLAGHVSPNGRPLVVIDLGVPRNVDPKLGELLNVRLQNLDGLAELVEATIANRRAEIPKADAMVADEMAAFEEWFDSLQVVPTIKLLKERFAAFEVEQFERQGRKFDADHHQEVAHYTRGLANRILHHPIAFLRTMSAEAGLSEQLAAVDMIRRMFDLDALESDR